MSAVRRAAIGVLGAATAVVMSTGPASAHECINASKQPDAGVQIIFNLDNEVVWVSKGLQQRIDKGVVDLETGEGFHGLIGLDMDGDGAADIATWIVGPTGEIPLKAQYNGPACKGVTNIDLWLEECATAPM